MLNSETSSPRLQQAGYRQALCEPRETDRAGVAAVSDIRLSDWDVLFGAVKARLMATVGERFTMRTLLTPHARAGHVRTSVLDCVAALDQLHTTLRLELTRCAALEVQLVDAQVALASARSELAGTQDKERRARHMALHDGLTGLPNRRYFCEHLDHTLAHLEASQTRLALFYLDLDDFKQINDQHGHQVGDEVLKVVASRLSRMVRSEDMFSRLGGDEFACLRRGPALDQPQLSQLAGKLFDAVSAPLRIGALKLLVRPSIGIALYPGDGCSSAALLKSADAAMYAAKRRHSGHAFSEPPA